MRGRLLAVGLAAGVLALRVRRERLEAAQRSDRAWRRAWEAAHRTAAVPA